MHVCVYSLFFQHGKTAAKRHWLAKEKSGSHSVWSANDDVKSRDMQKSSDTVPVEHSADPCSLWVDTYKPTNLREIIGQQGDKSTARKLYVWLCSWRNNFWKKPVCTFDLLAYILSLCMRNRNWSRHNCFVNYFMHLS